MSNSSSPPPKVVGELQAEDLAVLQLIIESNRDAELIRLEKSKVPTGTTSFVLPVTPEPTTVEPDPPWISFEVRNAGPGGVQAEVTCVGLLPTNAFIPAGGTKNIDFGFATITRVMFAAAPGTVATITVVATERKG